MDGQVRIAYIVLCHDEPELLKRVAVALKYEKDKLFVHVDKKKDITPFAEAVGQLDNVCFIEDRVEINWGGFSSVVATMNLLRAVLQDADRYNRIVLLQGKDYPLHSPAYIHSFFKEKREEEFCRASNITLSKSPGDYMKCHGYWNYDAKPTLMSKVIRLVCNTLNAKLKIKYRRGYFVTNGQRWDVYKGWAHMAITDAAAEYLLKVYDTMPRYNRFMKHRFPPDEIYIHTILFNSPFRDKISSYRLVPRPNAEWRNDYLNLTYFEYPVEVTVFKDAAHYEELVKTGALFFRKVTCQSSQTLLDEIDKHILENSYGNKQSYR